VGTGLIGTMVRSRLADTDRGVHNSGTSALTSFAAKIVLLDSALARYGKATKAARDQLREGCILLEQMSGGRQLRNVLTRQVDYPYDPWRYMKLSRSGKIRKPN
jgi:hypothetical protein